MENNRDIKKEIERFYREREVERGRVREIAWLLIAEDGCDDRFRDRWRN